MIYIALAAVIIAICAWITIPGPVPFTMQTFGISLVLLALGGVTGSAAIALYLLLGVIGVPVFAGFTGGIGHIAGPTGGYLVGFLVMGAAYTAVELICKNKQGKGCKLIGLGTGMILCYVFGTLWYVFVYGSGTSGFGAVAMVCVVPYIIPDAVKIALAVFAADRVKKGINR